MNLTQFQLTYELCPIILQNGIADSIPGSQLPIINLTQALQFENGILAPDRGFEYEDFIAHFSPVPGSTLIENQVGMYPFANQQVAANAIVVQPLKLSMLMVSPVDPNNGGYPAKLALFTSLQQQLTKHNILGGTYTVATPAMYYTNMLLVGLHDATGGEGKQVQAAWQWDFIKPLLTQADASQAYNGMMGKISGRGYTPGDPPSYSGTANAVGQSTSGVAPALVPGGSQAGGSSTSVGRAPFTTIQDPRA